MLRTGEGKALGSSDTQVQGTNDDAQLSKLSCAKLGYFKDDFIQYFVKKKNVRRSPLINRGYYSRYAGLRMLQQKFLEAAKQAGLPSQFIILGAGFDTAWLQLASEGHAPTKCLELDFSEVTKRKAAILASQPPLMELLQGHASASASQGQDGSSARMHICPTAGEVLCGDGAYSLLPADLRDLQAVQAAFKRAQLDPSAPTLILSECVLVYMEPTDSTNLVRMLGNMFSNASIVVYEQVRPHDAFGRQMRSNLEERGCPLLGLTSTPTLEAHCERLTKNGWQEAASWDMDTLYKAHLDPADQSRIERLEIFDEFEEWHMIQEHYCITVGVNSPDGGMQEGSPGSCRLSMLRGFGFGSPQCSRRAENSH